MRNIIIHTLLSLSLLSLGSCDKWIDVAPKTSIEEERMFSNELGFKEALNGVYLLMGDPAIYGRELTFGMTDVLGGMYVLSTTNGSLTYRQFQSGLYANVGPEALIVRAWEKSYNAISNINNLLSALETADQNLFTGDNARIIQGEALGLRAFLHFDMLRLFGTAPVLGGNDIRSIPYVQTYSTSVNPRLTSRQVLDLIKADLQQSLSLLAVDPLYTGQDVSGTENDLLLNRKLRFNYYAAKALLARVELWDGNLPEALDAAEDVIEVGTQKFPWVLQSAIATGNEAQRDRVFTTEHIFGLYVNNLADNYQDLLDTSRLTTNLIVNAARLNQQFESGGPAATDYRRIYLIREATGPNGLRIFFGKLYQPSAMSANFRRRIPLIRVPEMYYIAAECLAETNPTRALEYLTAVRTARGIVIPYASGLTSAQIKDEIRKEYWKEFPLEGQMFYYYKRTNAATVPGITTGFSSDRYVLPLPPREIEFGE